uniref:Uncharacterized protein n=1 Tax=Kalanchoe fedtschenkoi TaxID=63787 RepID=A0A7N0UM61_KALFE
MQPFVSIGIAVVLFFGLVSIGAAGKVYHLLRWRRKKLIESSGVIETVVGERGSDDNSGCGGVGLFCWRKTSPVHDIVSQGLGRAGREEEDLEMGLAAPKSFLGEGVEAELMPLHSLCGPPRFLFTIEEETVEDLASEDGKPTARLIDLIREADAKSSFISPIGSPVRRSLSSSFYCNGVLNPLFEASAEAELMSRLRSSPPPKFKFLRDAEEKMYRKLVEEEETGRVDDIDGGGRLLMPIQMKPRTCVSEVATVHDMLVHVVSL